MRNAARTDANQTKIVAAMRKAGASVWISKLPVDLTVGAGGMTCLVEIKTTTGIRNPRPKKYTKLQKDFMLTWKGGPVATITDVEGALNLVRAMLG